MDKKKIILLVITSILLIFTIAAKENIIDKNVDNDALKFKEEYENYNGKANSNNINYLNIEINEENPIVYSNYDEIIDIIKNETAVIYFGFPECPWCRNAVPVLLDAAKELSINKIYYYNALEIRDQKHLDENGNIVVDKEGTEEYKKLVELLYNNLPVYDGLNDESIKRMYFPTVLFVKEGKVIGLHTATLESQKNPSVKLDDNQYQELKQIYMDYMNKTFDILCDQSC